MAINGYFGRTGSGKSYSIVEYVIIPALKKGRHVVTNIPLYDELLTQVFGGQITQLPLDVLTVDDLEPLLPHGCVAVIDEVWHRWPSGQKVSAVSKSDLRLLKEHRHRVDNAGNAMQIVLATQDPADLALWVRNLIAHSFHMEKLDTLGADNHFSIKVYKGCPVGERKPQKNLVRDALGVYKPEIYQFYKSATQSQADDLSVGDEKAMDKRTTIWGSSQMIFLLCFIPFALIAGAYLFHYYFFGITERAAAKNAGSSSVQVLEAPELMPLPSDPAFSNPQAVAITAQSLQQEKPKLSGFWRVVGFMTSPVKTSDSVGGGEWLPDLVILEGWGGQRTVPVTDCQLMPASRYYSCIVDGELVTPWSGQQGTSELVGGRPGDQAKQLVGTSDASSVPTVRIASGATGGEQSGRDDVPVARQ